MNAKHDIEELLKRFRIQPSPRVKRAAMARYAESLGRGERLGGLPKVAGAGSDRGGAGLWRRPVPLYIAAALIVVAAGLAFVGGQELSRTERRARAASSYAQDTLTSRAPEQQWQFAPRDVL
jgi:hypothetical protein